MKKVSLYFTLVFALMSFGGIIVPSAYLTELCNRPSGQVAQELAGMRTEGAAELLGGICYSNNRPDIAAQIISPSVMHPDKAAAIVGKMAMLNATRLLAATEPNHANLIWAKMREQTPVQPLQVEGPLKGMDAGTAAQCLVSHPSADAAAGLICALRAEQAAHVFAPGVMTPEDAQRLSIAVGSRFGLTAVALNGHFIPGWSGQGGMRVGANGGQIAGVAAGDAVVNNRQCVAKCISDGISAGTYGGGGVSIQSCRGDCAKRGGGHNGGSNGGRCVLQ
jgi:hypothetical protein